MTRVMLLLVLLPVVSLAAPKKKKAPPAPPPPPTAPMAKVQENVADKVLETLSGATQVQAWRVAGTGGLRPDPTKAIGADFTREAPGKVLDDAQLKALRGLLYDDKSYRFEANVASCNFKPNAGFRFEQGHDVVEVLVSFGCNQVLFYVGKPGGRWLPSGTFDVRPARAKLLAQVKETLPDDVATQKLK